MRTRQVGGGWRLRGRPRSASGASTSREGFSLVELMVAFAVLVVSVGAIAHSLLQSVRSQRVSRETRTALNAAESVMESMKAEDLAVVFSAYNADPADDPVGGAPGASFAVRGLEALSGDPDGLPGEVVLPVDPAGALREDLPFTELGLPRDLSGDGAIDAADHGGDYAMLPVMVRVRWAGVSGPRTVRLVTTLRGL